MEGKVRDIVLKNEGLVEELNLTFVFNVKFIFKKLTEIVLIDGVFFEKVVERKVRGEEVEVELEVVVRDDEVVEFVSETIEVGVKDVVIVVVEEVEARVNVIILVEDVVEVVRWVNKVVDVIVKVVEEDDKIVEVLAEEVIEVVVDVAVVEEPFESEVVESSEVVRDSGVDEEVVEDLEEVLGVKYEITVEVGDEDEEEEVGEVVKDLVKNGVAYDVVVGEL